MSTARLVEVCVGGEVGPWRSLGLAFSNSSCDLSGVRLTVRSGAAGFAHWTIAVDADPAEEPSATGATHIEIDGIATDIVAPSPVERDGPSVIAGASMISGQRILGVDHVVVNTGDADRTCAAFVDSLGLDVRRTRDAGNGVEQRFFKMDNTIIEVVSGPHTRGSGASLWGLVVSVDDLFDLAETLGPDVLSPPKRAVQPGRFISTVRGSVGLGVPFALMTPH